jgi:hypothetical protein
MGRREKSLIITHVNSAAAVIFQVDASYQHGTLL